MVTSPLITPSPNESVIDNTYTSGFKQAVKLVSDPFPDKKLSPDKFSTSNAFS